MDSNDELIEQLQARVRELEGERSGDVSQGHGKQTTLLGGARSPELFQLILDSIPARVFWKDRNSVYLGCNRLFATDAGLDHPDSIVGCVDQDLAWAAEAEAYRADDRLVIESGAAKLDYEEPQTRSDESEIWLRTSKIPLRSPSCDVVGLLGTYEDITHRKRAEEKLRVSLREKEILLKELYHRTKNNLQVVQSMLTLKALENSTAAPFLSDVGDKVHAMGLVHQKLYESQSLNQIKLDEYLVDLAEHLLASFNAESRGISLVSDLQPVSISIDTAIPCGLVVSELLSNSLKHAFPEAGPGSITLGVSEDSSETLLVTVADSGIGLPDGFNIRADANMGIETVLGIVEHQLLGEVTVQSGSGLKWLLRLDGRAHRARI